MCKVCSGFCVDACNIRRRKNPLLVSAQNAPCRPGNAINCSEKLPRKHVFLNTVRASFFEKTPVIRNFAYLRKREFPSNHGVLTKPWTNGFGVIKCTFQLGIRCAEIYVQTVDQFVSTRRRLNFTWCSWAAWSIVKQLERDTALQTLLPPRDDMYICKQYSKQKSKIKQPLWWG